LNHLRERIKKNYIRIDLYACINECLDLEERISTEIDPYWRAVLVGELDRLSTVGSIIIGDYYDDQIYLDHLVFAIVLYVCVNEGASVTYSNPRILKKTISHYIDETININLNQIDPNFTKKILRNYIDILNKEFYENRLKYKLQMDGKNLLGWLGK
jgi:hypothetical protein